MNQTNSQLRDELQNLGLPTHGRKSELINRLNLHYQRLAQAKNSSGEFRYEECHLYTLPVLREKLDQLNLSKAGKKDELCRRLAEYYNLGQARSPAKSPAKSPKSPPRTKHFTLDQCDEWTTVRLKEKLGELGLSKIGKKTDLCQRLADYYAQQLPSTKKINNLLLIQPTSFQGERKRGGEFPNTVKFNLTNRMFNLLPLGPQEFQSHRGKKCQGNAFVFGPLLDQEAYSLLGSIKTDSSIGILNYDQWIQNPINLKQSPIWKELYPQGNFSNESKLALVQKEIPSLIWINQAEDPQLPIKLYGHFNRDGDLDSLIIDNSCFFP